MFHWFSLRVYLFIRMFHRFSLRVDLFILKILLRLLVDVDSNA